MTTRVLAVVAALCVNTCAVAPLTNTHLFGLVLDDGTLDAASHTVTVITGTNYSRALVFVDFTHSAASVLTATPWCSVDGTTYFRYSSRSVLSGTATVHQYRDSVAVSGNLAWLLDYDVTGCERFRVVFTDTDGGASDSIDVYVTGVSS